MHLERTSEREGDCLPITPGEEHDVVVVGEAVIVVSSRQATPRVA